MRITLTMPLLPLLALTMASRPIHAQGVPQAKTAFELVARAPRNPALPSIFIVGDSTADFHKDPSHEGIAAAQGWGIFLQDFFDPQKVNVVNAARSGRSSRTYITQGFWQQVLSMLKPGDVVLIQLGQNDVFPINDSTRARGTLPGTGPETQDIVNGVTHKPETVHTYGWYLRQMIQQTKQRGAKPIVLSLTPRDVWKDGHIEVGVGQYREWARTVALEEGNTDFVDMSYLLATQFDKLGQEKVAGLYHDREPVHMDTPGAYTTAELTVAGLKGLLDLPVARYLSRAGEMVVPADYFEFHWPANPKLPTVWILGDSTVRNGNGTGMDGMWGWGDELGQRLDPGKINVSNVAISGFSSRTYYTRMWPWMLPNIKPGDYVLMQFGHNDAGDPADAHRARASLKGIGPETTTIRNPLTGEEEVVHTYGWYMRQMIEDIRKAGAIPLVCTPVPRNQWRDGKVLAADYVQWASEVAKAEDVPLLNINRLIAAQYEKMGRQKTLAVFADRSTHTTLQGAEINADAVIEAIQSLPSTTTLKALDDAIQPDTFAQRDGSK